MCKNLSIKQPSAGQFPRLRDALHSSKMLVQMPAGFEFISYWGLGH